PSARTHPAVARHPEHQPFHPYVDTAAAYVTSEMKRLRRTTKWDDRLPSCALMLAVEKKLPIVRHPARHAAVVQVLQELVHLRPLLGRNGVGHAPHIDSHFFGSLFVRRRSKFLVLRYPIDDVVEELLAIAGRQ